MIHENYENLIRLLCFLHEHDDKNWLSATLTCKHTGKKNTLNGFADSLRDELTRALERALAVDGTALFTQLMQQAKDSTQP